MYRITEEEIKEKSVLFVPAMLDAHFPLLKYAFYSHNYHPVILDNEEGITDIGLKYVNYDMCYPCILIVGQMLGKLMEGEYDPARVKLLMPSAGDACRGANYTGVLRRSVRAAGFSGTEVLSLNAVGLDAGHAMVIEPGMVWRALFGLFYGDILMLLVNQTRPYELEQGAVQKCYEKWLRILSEDLKNGSGLTIRRMKQNFEQIAGDFSRISRSRKPKQRIGIIGEIYTKYCHLGNWNMIEYLEKAGCETHTNGLSWYVMYYLDSHLTDTRGVVRYGYRWLLHFVGHIQNAMICTLRNHDFYTLDGFQSVKKEAEPYVDFHFRIGDGWLIGAEAVAHIRHGCKKVLAIQPFGCMPNHTCGRGLYPSISRSLPEGQIVSVDMDPGVSTNNVYNRVMMLVHSEL